MSNVRLGILLFALVHPTGGAAVPPYYVPDHEWLKGGWQCKKTTDLSFVEVERIRDPVSNRTEVKISAIQVNGRKIDPRAVEGLSAYMEGLDGIKTIAGRCGTKGESLEFTGYARGRADPLATEYRPFYVPYAQLKR